MTMFRKVVSAAAVAAAFVSTMPAVASTVASADLAITSLGLFNEAGTGIAPGSLKIWSEGRTGNSSSLYNGVVGTGAGAGSKSSNIIGATVDVKRRCAGDCGPGTEALYGAGGEVTDHMENNFTNHLATPGTKNFALGDMFIGGSILGVGPTGVSGLTRANAMSSGPTNEGSGNATILNNAQYSSDFSTDVTFTGKIGVGATSWLQAFVDSVMPVTGTASAAFGWNIKITSTDDAGFTTLNFAPDDLNQGFLSTNFSENQLFTKSDVYFSDVRTFKENKKYNITINQSSNAIISEVPEPATLALVGLGLLGAGLARRRATK